MSPDIEWQIGDETGEETIRYPTPRPPRWRKWILWAVMVLGVGLGIAYRSIPEPPRPTSTLLPTVTPAPTKLAVPVKLYETIDREAQALADGDVETILAVRLPENQAWIDWKRTTIEPWGHPADNGPLYTIIAFKLYASTRAWADVSQFRNGQYFRETRFYRQVNSQWLRTQPDFAFWREPYQSFQTKHFEVSYPPEDNALILMVAYRFEAAYVQVCADLDCPSDLAPIRLMIYTDGGQLHWSGSDRVYTIDMLSPRISGMYDTVGDETARRLGDPVTRAAYQSLISILAQITSGGIAWMPSDPTHGGAFFTSAIIAWENNRVSSHPDVSQLLPPPELITNTQLVRLASLWDTRLTPSNPEQLAASGILFIEQKFGASSVGKFLKAIGPARSFAQAIEASLGVDEAQFEQQWKDWLRRLSVKAGQ